MQLDKVAHALAGAYASQYATSIAYDQGLGPLVAVAIGVSVAAVAGLAKDYGYDAYMNRQSAKQGLPDQHTVDRADAVATAYGGVAAGVMSALYYGVKMYL